MRLHVIAIVVVLVACQVSRSESTIPPTEQACSTEGHGLQEIPDPRIGHVMDLKATILEQERLLAEQQEEIFRATEAALTRFDPETLKNARETLDGMRELTRVLYLTGNDLLLLQSRFSESLATHEGTLFVGAESYLQAAEAARQWAKEAKFQNTKVNYLTMAETWEYFAERLAEKGRLVNGQETQLQATIAFLEETVLFLKRLHDHLSTLFRLDEIGEREKYLDSLKTFIESYQRFESLFRDFHRQLSSHSLRADVTGREAQGNDPPEELLATADSDSPIKPPYPDASSSSSPCTPSTLIVTASMSLLAFLAIGFWQLAPNVGPCPKDLEEPRPKKPLTVTVKRIRTASQTAGSEQNLPWQQWSVPPTNADEYAEILLDGERWDNRHVLDD